MGIEAEVQRGPWAYWKESQSAFTGPENQPGLWGREESRIRMRGWQQEAGFILGKQPVRTLSSVSYDDARGTVDSNRPSWLKFTAASLVVSRKGEATEVSVVRCWVNKMWSSHTSIQTGRRSWHLLHRGWTLVHETERNELDTRGHILCDPSSVPLWTVTCIKLVSRLQPFSPGV